MSVVCEWCGEKIGNTQPALSALHIHVDQCLDETEGMVRVAHELQTAGKMNESLSYLEKIQENLLTLLIMSTVSDSSSSPMGENDEDDDDEEYVETNEEEDEEEEYEEEEEEEETEETETNQKEARKAQEPQIITNEFEGKNEEEINFLNSTQEINSSQN
eukprot:CAMPEP_0201477208 /NCGR_PEP_ID=MMETSP0151_2-20130828/2274_1 /ASSEMBLY_ACC=CAM_ASM_000257 /TAXON_ID=200890 /ORGANISM="Paramoeba atlantica, Strain 621/1 / CCAP 1560/9" /LENGTH=159 /DNA_ID=CAMNT_0047857841 /DNA_START=135 /DNA_END=611 /DNA_ORIENTATION=+